MWKIKKPPPFGSGSAFLWVGNGDRTHDPQDHNLIL